MLAASQSSHSLDALALAATLLAIAAGMLGIVTIGMKYYGRRRGRLTAAEKTLAEMVRRQLHRDTGTEHTERHKTPHND
jgi:hypothetical protein